MNKQKAEPTASILESAIANFEKRTQLASDKAIVQFHELKKILLKHNPSYAPLFLRIFIALVIFPHGAQKVFGWFGGFGFTGTMQYFTATVGLPWLIGFLVVVIEFVGPIAILLGWATRLWSLALGIVMVGIIATTFTTYFFMNWFGNQPAEGAEFFLLVIGMTASLVISGSGKCAIDNIFSNH